MIRWIDDPSDPKALADACSRHEQWLVRHAETRLAEGWNAQGDIQVFDVPALVEMTAENVPKKPRSQKPVGLVAASRDSAIALLERARAAGFARVLYRDPSGVLWDPHPPGDWMPAA